MKSKLGRVDRDPQEKQEGPCWGMEASVSGMLCPCTWDGAQQGVLANSPAGSLAPLEVPRVGSTLARLWGQSSWL